MRGGNIAVIHKAVTNSDDPRAARLLVPRSILSSVNRKRAVCATGKMGLKRSSYYRFTKPRCIHCVGVCELTLTREKEIMASVMEYCCRWQ
jgi:hypothetical protein